MDFSQGGEHRLKSKKLITRVFSEGKAVKAYPVLAIVLQCEDDSPWKAGFSVARKRLPRAVDRNLIKRRMREALRLNFSKYLSDKHQGLAFMLIYADHKVNDYQVLERSVCRILKELKESMESDIEQH